MNIQDTLKKLILQIMKDKNCSLLQAHLYMRDHTSDAIDAVKTDLTGSN